MAVSDVKTLTIYRHYFTNSDCYKSGVIQSPTGIQVHSTGANNSYLKRYVGPDDGLLGKNQYNNTHNKPGGDVCANAYIGRLNNGTPAIYQALPWNMRCWLSASGSNGNANKLGFVGFEICEDNRKNAEYFQQVVMGLSVNLCAYLCQEYKIPIEKVLDHSELYKMGIASNHGDITWWLKNFGYDMNDYREAVRKALIEGVQVQYVDPEKQEEKKTMFQAKVVAKSGNTVNFRATMNGEILAAIPIGTIVDVINQPTQIWSEIKFNNQTGYMMTKFLQKIETSDDKIKLQEIKAKLEEAIALINKLLA